MNEIARCPLPCPFCGKPPEVTHMPVELYNGCIPTRERASWMIRCASLSCCGPSAHSETGEADAIEKWNRRPAAPDDGKGQPVAWRVLNESGAWNWSPNGPYFWTDYNKAYWEANRIGGTLQPLYTHPAPQDWQGAAREIDDCFDADGVMHYEGKICVSGDDRERAIEAILKRHQEGKAPP